MVGLMVTSSKRAYSLPRSADPYLCRRHSKAGLTPSLWGSPGVQKFCLSPLSVWWVWSLILNVISPLLLSCWGFYFALGRVFLFSFFFFFMGSNILLSTVVQQQVVILEFLQEKMSSPPATLPSNAL